MHSMKRKTGAMFTYIQLLSLLCIQYAVSAQIQVDIPDLNTGPGEEANSCEACEMIVERVKGLLLKPEVQEMIKNNMTTVCDMLQKAGAAGLCKAVVDRYLPIVFIAAEKVLNQDDLCSNLDLCGENEMTIMMEQVRTALTSPYLEQTPRTFCFLCTFVVDRVLGLLPIDQVEDVLVTVLGLVCDVLPGAIQLTCHTLADTVISTLLGVLRGVLSSDVICGILQFCSHAEEATLMPV
ncbi:pulmonary surfactant-associated protein B-like [Engraulis encrasicolus]|uniref:pulmonary surfactant-associated protein B-like n=1 Tax=Engraulis encrasicolus TaxID=184585 RepID=UPI002FD09A04